MEKGKGTALPFFFFIWCLMKRSLLIIFLAALTLVSCGRTGTKSTGKSTGNTSEKTSEKKEDYSDMSDDELEVASYDGDGKAAITLGQRFDYGENDESQDFSKAFKWYTKASELGESRAYVYLGYLYMNGLGCDKSLDTAAANFNKAIALGDNEGYSGLGRMYFLNRDLTDAESNCYYNVRRASDAGSVMGKYLLARLYEEGYGVGQNLEEARKLYKENADKSFNGISLYNTYPYTESAVRLGILYAGQDSSSDEKKECMQYFNKAAQKGSAEGCYYCGAVLQSGTGTDKDYNEAIKYYSKSAEMGYAPAINQMGYIYFNGYGVDQSVSRAEYYFKLAAAQGYAPSQINLGYIYENGIGEAVNLDLAKQYYQLAQAQNFSGAEEAVTRVDTLINTTNSVSEN